MNPAINFVVPEAALLLDEVLLNDDIAPNKESLLGGLKSKIPKANGSKTTT